MSNAQQIEEGKELLIDFDKIGKIGRKGYHVVPVAVQDFDTREVLQIAYVNEEALRLSLAEARAVFFSTSRAQIWRKGETSGDILDLVEIRTNCEQNSLLFLVRKRTPGSCHTRDMAGNHRGTCFYRRVLPENNLKFLD